MKETKTQAQQATYDQLQKLAAEDKRKEQDGRKVKQGTENAPVDTAPKTDEKKPANEPPYTTAREDQGDQVPVTLADGTQTTVNAEAQNTTQTLADRGAIDENPATKALREQEQRRLAASSIVHPDVAAAAEQARQNEVIGRIEPEGKK